MPIRPSPVAKSGRAAATRSAGASLHETYGRGRGPIYVGAYGYFFTIFVMTHCGIGKLVTPFLALFDLFWKF
jgi:hypothetical protein